jgi:hypothetical protein
MKYIVVTNTGKKWGMDENINGKLDVKESDGTAWELVLTEE